jgi:hypothetical protein
LLSGQSRRLETLNVNGSNAGCANYFHAAASQSVSILHPTKRYRIIELNERSTVAVAD